MLSEELQKKVDRAIKLIQSASKVAKEHKQPLEIAYSGGKDSDVILELAKMACVEYRAIYKNTTIDPKGTIKHVIEMGVEIKQPSRTFFKIIEEHGMPSNRHRFCCGYLKEYKIFDYVIVGVRKEESAKRAKLYKEPEICRVYKNKEKARLYFPILDWTSNDIKDFIIERKIKCAPIYYDDKGNFHVERRLGCMCCPMLDKKRIEQFKQYPNMVKAYAKSLRKFRDSHPDCKAVKIYKDEYEQLARDVFYWRTRQVQWINNQKSELFDSPNYKTLLENYFNIKFN